MSLYTEWKTAVSTKKTDRDTLMHYRQCGVQALELSIAWPNCESIDWAGYKKHADEAGLELWSYHLPFGREVNIASPDEAERRDAVDALCVLAERALSIGIRHFIVHPSAEPVPVDERSAWMAASQKSLKELAQFIDERGAVLCVEDLPRSCLGHDVKEMLELVNCDSRLRVCFDVNHLLLEFGATHREFIEKLGPKIVTTHISDYDFIDEKHFFPGFGKIDWKTLVEDLENAGYSGPFLYEGGFSPSHWAPEVPFGKIEDVRTRQMTIKELRGCAE